MSIQVGPKLRQLNSSETLSTLESWFSQVKYNLTLNPQFLSYLKEGAKFGRKTKTKTYRDLVDDTTGDSPLSKEAKCIHVDLMVEQIANWADLIPRNDIIKDCGSLDDIWQTIRRYYNLETTGSLLNRTWNLTRLPDETPQALFSRLKQLYDNNLLRKQGLTHVDGKLTEDEEMGPTLHNTIVLHWLNILHPRLRDLVTQKFSSELRDRTYASIFPEISRSINDLLSEVSEGATVMRAWGGSSYTRGGFSSKGSGRSSQAYSGNERGRGRSSGYRQRCCEYCKLAKRECYRTHDIGDCWFIGRDNGKVNLIDCPDEEEEEREVYVSALVTEHILSRVSSCGSPVLPLWFQDEMCSCTLDTGATCSCVRSSFVNGKGLKIRPTNQTIRMADGLTPLPVRGEVDLVFYREGKDFHMVALVVDEADTDILGGMPFMHANDIGLRPARNEIIIYKDSREEDIVTYNPVYSGKSRPGRPVRRLLTYDVVTDHRRVVLPGESYSVPVPSHLSKDQPVIIEPRFDTSFNSRAKESAMWPPPQVVEPVNGILSVENSSDAPIELRRAERIFQILDTCDPVVDVTSCDSLSGTRLPHRPHSHRGTDIKKVVPYSTAVQLNKDKILSPSTEVQFKDCLLEYDEVFNPRISRYNGHSGPCSAEVNMGPTRPPQRKGRIPMYSKDKLELLQSKFDELESKGVFARPQELGVTVEYVSPSFLVKKKSGDFRLVTNFRTIQPYVKPSPTLLPDVNSTLLKVGAWKYVAVTDFADSYYQIPMKRESMKYCGVVTPFKGVRVYTTSCMGLPGSETALEELTCLVLGDLVRMGIVAKIADDLFIGGATESELLDNFRVVVHRLRENNLTLSARKTVIAPVSTEILGWTWCRGKLQASAHRIAALAACERPETVSAMRSYLGSYKFLCRVLKDHAAVLEPLESAIAGKEGRSKIVWTDGLSEVFVRSQEALKSNKAITLPIPSDVLWIVTDGSLRNKAVGATLYVVRDGVPKLGGFFSSRVTKCQAGWLACEIEGVAIASALHYFAPLIRQSIHSPRVLTDSKPCVQACEKFSRGQFSTSSRLCTFLNAVGVYRAEIGHISGVSNVVSDFASRNCVECVSPGCEICKFVNELTESVVAGISFADIESGRVRIPFTNPAAWLATQAECKDLAQVKFYCQQGSVVPRKVKGDIRRYMSSQVILNSKGLLVVREAEPLKAVHDRIVVPRSVVVGLLMSLHIQCDHPRALQMKRIFKRFFFALNIDMYIDETTAACYQCAAMKDIPKSLIKQSTDIPPETVASSFAADVVKRHGQKIFVIRETVTSYTSAELIRDETALSLNEAILRACSRLRPSEASLAVIRVDPHPSHQSLFNGCGELLRYNIRLDMGRVKNVNKNPVIDKAIKELIREIQIKSPQGGPLSSTTLELAVAALNSRIRGSGLSAHELWTQRDQVSHVQLPICDKDIIDRQNKTRQDNHKYSEQAKAQGKSCLPEPRIRIGDLVYIYSDGNKLAPRPRYVVTDIRGHFCTARKMDRTLFASKTYDLRLDEVYKVPGFTYDWCDDSDSDDDMLPVSWEQPSRFGPVTQPVLVPHQQHQPVLQPEPVPVPQPVLQPEPVPQPERQHVPVPQQVIEPVADEVARPVPIVMQRPLNKQGPPGSPVTGPPRRAGLRDRDLLNRPGWHRDYKTDPPDE